MPETTTQILYCRCAFAQVVPQDVKDEVLRRLCDAGVPFEAVADLCEMSARRDPSLKALAEGGALRIAACHPRAVEWLFHAAGAPLPAEGGAVVANMRENHATEIVERLLNQENGAARDVEAGSSR